MEDLTNQARKLELLEETWTYHERDEQRTAEESLREAKWKEKEAYWSKERKEFVKRDEQRTAEESLREAKWKEKEAYWSEERKEFVKREWLLKKEIAICEYVILRVLLCLVESDEETEEATEEAEMEEDDGSQEKTMPQVRENLQDFSANTPEPSAGPANPTVETSAHEQTPVPVGPQLNGKQQTDLQSDTEAPKDNRDQGFPAIKPKKDTNTEEEIEGATTQAARTQKIIRRKNKLRRRRRNKRH